MLRLPSVVVLFGALLSCSSDGSAEKDAGPMERQIAPNGIAITGIAHFQGVKIPIMIDGAANDAATRPYAAASKPSLFRVYIKHDDKWSTRPLECVLDITLGDGSKMSLTAMVPDVTKSTDDAMDSTINFDLPVELMTPETTYSVKILEIGKMAPVATGPLDSRWPVDGTQTSLDVHSSGSQVKIMLVPIRYNADGSGRLPYTNQVQIDEYQQLLYDTYPTPGVELTMHKVVDWNFAVQASGAGWDNLLGYIVQLRMNEKPPPDVYYYGLFEPAATLMAYCGTGCVLGLALLGTDPTGNIAKGAIGVGFPDPTSGDTLLHEVAHNMGRQHTACGTPMGVDKNFPYPGGSTGVWGWSLSKQTLRPPDMNKDFMGYCDPKWISDYTYRGLFDRIKFVNNASIIAGPTKSMRAATWDGTKLTWGQRFTRETPIGEMQTIGGVTGWYYAFDHVPGGMILVPD